MKKLIPITISLLLLGCGVNPDITAELPTQVEKPVSYKTEPTRDPFEEVLLGAGGEVPLFCIKGTLAQGETTRDALAYNYGYKEIIKENGEWIDNPESKVAFAKRKITDFMKENVIAYRQRVKAEIDRQATLNSAKAELDGLITQ